MSTIEQIKQEIIDWAAANGCSVNVRTAKEVIQYDFMDEPEDHYEVRVGVWRDREDGVGRHHESHTLGSREPITPDDLTTCADIARRAFELSVERADERASIKAQLVEEFGEVAR